MKSRPFPPPRPCEIVWVEPTPEQLQELAEAVDRAIRYGMQFLPPELKPTTSPAAEGPEPVSP